MADTSSSTNGAEDGSKQAFVPEKDRPDVRLTLDTPLSELRVRELAAILGSLASKNQFEYGKTSLTDFFNKPDMEVVEEPELFPKGADGIKPPKAEKVEKVENDKSLKEWWETIHGQKYPPGPLRRGIPEWSNLSMPWQV